MKSAPLEEFVGRLRWRNYMTVFDMMITTPATFALTCAAVMACGGVGIFVLKCYNKSGRLTPCKSIGYVPPPPPPCFSRICLLYVIYALDGLKILYPEKKSGWRIPRRRGVARNAPTTASCQISNYRKHTHCRGAIYRARYARFTDLPQIRKILFLHINNLNQRSVQYECICS